MGLLKKIALSIFCRKLIPKFYAASDKKHPFRIEDVYYTGIVPQLIDENVDIVNIEPWFPWRPKAWPKDLSKSIMVFEMNHYHSRKSIIKLWKKIEKKFVFSLKKQ